MAGDETEKIPLAVGRAAVAPSAGQTVFGRFILEAEVGRGGMGVVWRVRDKTLGETVALKFLPAEVASDAVAVEEMKEETRKARKLRHHNIVSVFDFFQDQEWAAVSMEFVDGVNLAELQRRKSPPVFAPAELAPIIVQICAAMDYAHLNASIAHCDIKPANILVTSSGVVKIADFGIAKSIGASTKRGAAQSAAHASGTVRYMSPQQIRGESPTASDDIFALGTTLYELLAGRTPFYQGDIGHQILSLPSPPLNERRRQTAPAADPVPKHWVSAIANCLAKHPSRRPATAGALLRGLEIPGAEFGPLTAYWRRKWVWFAAVGALIVMAWVVAQLFWPAGERARGADETRRQSAATVPAARSEPVPEAKREPAAVATVARGESGAAPAVSGLVNSLGMRLIELRPHVWMSATLVRRSDYAKFDAAQAPERGGLVFTIGSEGWEEIKGSWRSPGFDQAEDEPVVGVSWEEAQEFCRWLTAREVAASRIDPDQRYRLPTEAEWVAMAESGGAEFAWGAGWPPQSPSGNFAGAEVMGAQHKWPEGWSYIDGYNDTFGRTSPVTAFPPNKAGFYDVAGNVSQWCEDTISVSSQYRVTRGSSWADYLPARLKVGARQGNPPSFRSAAIGFRLVLGRK